jgi:ubiquinone/menaquinone biosynthesis C-methylase UbiE
MLPRVLETEVMDTAEEAAEYDAMDHSEVNARFVGDFLAVHGYCRGGTVLDVGTGTALIPIALCQADPNARVLAIDLADHMLTLAQRNVECAGLASRIALHRADAKVIGPGYGRFEAVVSNSIVHHIPEPGVVLQEMVRLVAPGGTLFVRDLARPDSPEELDRLVSLYAGAESPTARALFAASLHAALTVAEVRELLEPHGLPADCVRMTSDRHWTCAWRRP